MRGALLRLASPRTWGASPRSPLTILQQSSGVIWVVTRKITRSCSYRDPKDSPHQLQLHRVYVYLDLHRERGSIIWTLEIVIAILLCRIHCNLSEFSPSSAVFSFRVFHIKFLFVYDCFRLPTHLQFVVWTNSLRIFLHRYHGFTETWNSLNM